MDPGLGSVIGAGVSAAGGLAGSWLNANSAGIDRDDRRYYAEHAHQVEVADLKAAGLNPILAAGGRGASFQGASGSDVGGSLAAGVESAGKQVGTFAARQNEAAIAELQAAGMITDNSNKLITGMQQHAALEGSYLQNQKSALELRKLGIEAPFWQQQKALELMLAQSLMGLQDAQATANQASARWTGTQSDVARAKLPSELANMDVATQRQKLESARTAVGIQGDIQDLVQKGWNLKHSERDYERKGWQLKSDMLDYDVKSQRRGYHGYIGDAVESMSDFGRGVTGISGYVTDWIKKLNSGQSNMSVGQSSAKYPVGYKSR